VASLNANASVYLEEALRRAQARDVGQLRRAQVQVPELLGAPKWLDQLVLAADNFVFSRPLPDVPDGESVIAGYPWFGDWGRDTMIALPGLTLATGRFDTARRILETFARFVDRGMLPNVFPGAGDKPEYNTVDAALWYIEAWRAYVDALDDIGSLKRVFPVLESIVDWHLKGTRYGIGVDAADGLVKAGEDGVQLTWMDAKVGDWVVTPRIGKPVEINALWFNALNVMAGFARRLKLPAERYRELAAKAREGFSRFVRQDGDGLNDVIDGPWGDDVTLRPNQIFAVSLPHSPLDAQLQRRVVEVVGRELLTSYGLRSLNPGHADYRPQYRGGVWERDGSYHQGPVWAFLLGHYALAEHRTFGDAAAAQARLDPLRDHLLDAGLGTVSEILDGASAHTPRGAPSQAWSVACTLEAWWKLEKAKREMNRQGAKDAKEGGKDPLVATGGGPSRVRAA
jgi:4-alpha-glucanotransferase